MQGSEYSLGVETSPERRTQRVLINYPRLVPVGIFLLIAAVTALGVFAIERGENQREAARMQETTRALSSALERRGGSSSAYLRAGAALFTTIGEVNEGQFRDFVAELWQDADYRGAEGIGWAEYRRGPDGASVPIIYLEPDTVRNRRALGYDMYSEPVRRAAMDEAVSSVRPVASGNVVLKQEGGRDAPGFLVYMPVFEGGVAGRRLKGFIYSPFNAQDFLASALELETRGDMGIRLYDGAPEPDNLMAEVPPAVMTGVTQSAPVMVASRPMTLMVESARAGTLSPLSMITLLFGLAVASLLMLVIRLLTQQAYEDQSSITWFAEQNSIRDSLTRELNHRVKNTLANVLSIISLTRRRADDVDQFADGLDGRVRALSATHDLLTQSEWGTTPLKDVLEVELAPYAQEHDSALHLSGPHVELAPNDALSFGLAIHELATNAAKYGALSVPDGEVHVEWELTDEGLARIQWRESNGPPVAPRGKRGFGMDLIEKIVAHELRHPVDLDFAPQGVRCTLLVPIRRPQDFRIRASNKFRA